MYNRFFCLKKEAEIFPPLIMKKIILKQTYCLMTFCTYCLHLIK